MQNAVHKNEGGMVAVLGEEIKKIEEILNINKKKFSCYLANDNSIGQTVISGKIDDLNSQIAKLTEKLPLLQKFESLIQDESKTQRLEFASASDPYNGLSGEVIWNDDKQEGYMSLENLAVNDPRKNQYQLWIVDPERDELPVDGGVFDITQKDGKSIIPIRNALAINKPVAFVITLEQPGGVVKSKQEVVVALAKS